MYIDSSKKGYHKAVRYRPPRFIYMSNYIPKVSTIINNGTNILATVTVTVTVL